MLRAKDALTVLGDAAGTILGDAAVACASVLKANHSHGGRPP